MVVAEVSAACSGGALRVRGSRDVQRGHHGRADQGRGQRLDRRDRGQPRRGLAPGHRDQLDDQREGEDGPQQPGRVGQEPDDRAVGQRAGEEPLGLLPSGPGPGQRRPGHRGQPPGQAGQQRRDHGDPGCGAQQPPGQRSARLTGAAR